MTDTVERAYDAAIGYYGNYQEYNKLLRTWFVAFGIGGPALLYSKPELLQELSDTDRSRIVWALLLGSAIQVVLALINKTVSWVEHNYHLKRTKNLTLGRNRLERICIWLDNKFGVDVLFDLFSAAIFAYAMFQLAGAALRVAEPTAIVPPPN
jgi:hypothetical protein